MNFSQVPSHLRSVLEKMCLDAERRGYERGVLEGRLNGQAEFVSGLKALGVLLPQLVPQQNPVAVMNLSQEIPDPEDDFEIDLDEMVPSAQGDEKTNAFKMLILASVQEAYTARGEDPTELIEALSQILDDPVEVRKWMSGRGDATDLAWQLLKPGMQGYKGKTAKAVWDDPTAGKKPLYGTAAENAFRRQQAFAGEVGDDEVGQARKLLGEDEQAIAVAKGRRAEQIHGQLMQKERFGAEDVQSLEQVLPTLNFRQLGAIRQKLMASLGLDPKKNKEGLTGQGRVEQRIQKLKEAIPQLIQAAQKAIASGETEQGGEPTKAEMREMNSYLGKPGTGRFRESIQAVLKVRDNPDEAAKHARSMAMTPDRMFQILDKAVEANPDLISPKPKRGAKPTTAQLAPEPQSEPVAQEPEPQVEKPVQEKPTADEQPQPEPESASIDATKDAEPESIVENEPQVSAREAAIAKNKLQKAEQFTPPDDEVGEPTRQQTKNPYESMDDRELQRQLAIFQSGRAGVDSRAKASYAQLADVIASRDADGSLGREFAKLEQRGITDRIVSMMAEGKSDREILMDVTDGKPIGAVGLKAVRAKRGVPSPNNPDFKRWQSEYQSFQGKVASDTTPPAPGPTPTVEQTASPPQSESAPEPRPLATTPEPTPVVEQTIPQQPQTAVQSDVGTDDVMEKRQSFIESESKKVQYQQLSPAERKRVLQARAEKQFPTAKPTAAKPQTPVAPPSAKVETGSATATTEDVTSSEPKKTQSEQISQQKSDYDPAAFSADETNDSYVRDSLFKIAKVPVDKRGESASVLAETAKSVLGQDESSLATIADDNFMTVDELKQSLSRIAQGVDTRKASRPASESAAASLNREMGGSLESGDTSPLAGLPTEPKSRAKSIANKIDKLKAKLRGNITDAKKSELESQIAELESEQKKTIAPEPAQTSLKKTRKPKATPTPATEPEVVTPAAPQPNDPVASYSPEETGFTGIAANGVRYVNGVPQRKPEEKPVGKASKKVVNEAVNNIKIRGSDTDGVLGVLEKLSDADRSAVAKKMGVEFGDAKSMAKALTSSDSDTKTDPPVTTTPAKSPTNKPLAELSDDELRLEFERRFGKNQPSSQSANNQSAPTKVPDPAELEASVMDTFHRLLREKHVTGRIVPIHEVRAEIEKQFGPEAASHRVLNPIMNKLDLSGVIRLVEIDDRSQATPEELQASIPSRTGLLYFIKRIDNDNQA